MLALKFMPTLSLENLTPPSVRSLESPIAINAIVIHSATEPRWDRGVRALSRYLLGDRGASLADRVRVVSPAEWKQMCDPGANNTSPNRAAMATLYHQAGINHFLGTGHRLGEVERVKKPYVPAKPKKDILRFDGAWRGARQTGEFKLMPEAERYANPNRTYLGYIELARHHTTKARSKLERAIDCRFGRGGFKVEGGAQSAQYFMERGPSETKIFPLALPRLKRLRGRKRKRYCRFCNTPFKCKRIDAEYCSPKCKKAANRAGKR